MSLAAFIAMADGELFVDLIRVFDEPGVLPLQLWDLLRVQQLVVTQSLGFIHVSLCVDFHFDFLAFIWRVLGLLACEDTLLRALDLV